jgi:histidine phosphotransferase ChpT
MQVEFRVLELLASRLCHELISPVGAISNGVELMGEEDPGFVKQAQTLVAQSARKAGNRLQFYRFAYGASGTGAGTPEPRELVAGIFEGGKIFCDWPKSLDALPVEWQKLACNLALLAADTLPRGGKVSLAPVGKRLEAVAAGEVVNITPELKAALGSKPDPAALTARNVHAYFTARYAEQLGAKLTLTADDKRASFMAG